jgi:hypothetical protein
MVAPWRCRDPQGGAAFQNLAQWRMTIALKTRRNMPPIFRKLYYRIGGWTISQPLGLTGHNAMLGMPGIPHPS